MSTSSLPSFIKIHPAVLEKKLKMWKVYGRTDGRRRRTDGRCAMTIAHSSLRLRWAKKQIAIAEMGCPNYIKNMYYTLQIKYRIYYIQYLLIWSMAPAQNLPKNFLAPRFLRSVMRYGQRCRTLLREKLSRFSSSTTLQPRKAASMAVRRPHGPPPITRTYRRNIKVTFIAYTCACSTHYKEHCHSHNIPAHVQSSLGNWSM